MTDAFAIDTARNAITAALEALKVAYDASRDPRVEDTITSLTDSLMEYRTDLDCIADQIEADAPAGKSWFVPYAAV
jgi:hypothetical protein